jgi:hypothetical protein
LHHSWLAPWWIGRTKRTTLLVVGAHVYNEPGFREFGSRQA